jgi:hypothetical protein
MRAARGDEHCCHDDPGIRNHIVRRKNPACAHVCSAAAVFCDERHAVCVRNERHEGDADHETWLRLAANDKPAHDLEQYAQREGELQKTAEPRRTRLQRSCFADGVEAYAVYGRIPKHIERVGDEADGLGKPAGDNFDEKRCAINHEYKFQRSRFTCVLLGWRRLTRDVVAARWRLLQLVPDMPFQSAMDRRLRRERRSRHINANRT